MLHMWQPARMARRAAQVYRNKQFKDAKQYLRENYVQCWVTDNAGRCTRRGTIPDHDPPIATFRDPTQWVGRLLAMCPYHSCRQRGMMRHQMHIPAPTRLW